MAIFSHEKVPQDSTCLPFIPPVQMWAQANVGGVYLLVAKYGNLQATGGGYGPMVMTCMG